MNLSLACTSAGVAYNLEMTIHWLLFSLRRSFLTRKWCFGVYFLLKLFGQQLIIPSKECQQAVHHRNITSLQLWSWWSWPSLWHVMKLFSLLFFLFFLVHNMLYPKGNKYTKFGNNNFWTTKKLREVVSCDDSGFASLHSACCVQSLSTCDFDWTSN